MGLFKKKSKEDSKDIDDSFAYDSDDPNKKRTSRKSSVLSKQTKAHGASGSLLKAMGIATPLCLVVCIIPVVPWFRANAFAYMGARFTRPRQYSLWGATNHMGTMVTWMKYRHAVCRKFQEFSSFDPTLMAAGLVSTVVQGGGALGGCATWSTCVSHVGSRCVGYGQLFAVACVTSIFYLVAMILPTMSFSALSKEHLLKGDELELARRVHKRNYIITTALIFVGTVAYIGTLLYTTHSFNQTAFYPVPSPFIGPAVAAVALILSIIGLVAGILHAKQPLTDDELEGAKTSS